ncbi:MAG: radical SAM protein [Pyrobaculum sp.]
MRLRVIRPFDPWKNPLCTCPPKYSLNPYTGCGHRCLYCYITSYIPNAFSPRPKDIGNIIHDLEALPPGALIAMSNSSDPYTPPEDRLGYTRKILETALGRGHYILITTKSDLVLRDVDLFKKYRDQLAIQITITTLDEELASVLEPGAPTPWRRLAAVAELARWGISVGVRLDPIVPFLNDSIEDLVKEVAEAGAKQLVVSTYKAKRDNFKRLAAAFPQYVDKWRELYFEKGRYFHGQWYADIDYRREILRRAAELARRHNLQFSICREEFRDLETPRVKCDGSHFINRGAVEV